MLKDGELINWCDLQFVLRRYLCLNFKSCVVSIERDSSCQASEMELFGRIVSSINPFLAKVPILYPLKTPENLWFSGVFRGYKIGTLARNGLRAVSKVKSFLVFSCRIKWEHWPKRTNIPIKQKPADYFAM